MCHGRFLQTAFSKQIQGFSYAILVVLSGRTATDDAGSSEDDRDATKYLLPSVTGATYLLVASTTHDLRAGFSLLVDGNSAGHRAFGIGLLIVYGIMLAAAMKVLASTSADSASVVLNAVSVLFIADLVRTCSIRLTIFTTHTSRL